MATVIYSLFLFFIFFLSVNGNVNVADFGAKGDGKTNATEPFLKAWAAACKSYKPTVIVVPLKRYLLDSVAFNGPCNNTQITIQLNGVLAAPSDYKDMGTSSNWVSFSNVEGLSIIGGYMDGQGSSLWSCKNNGGDCPDGAKSLGFYSSKGVTIKGLTSINSKLSHIVIDQCEDVTVTGVRIYAPEDSPNTDGIHVEESTGVNILSTGIKTGDDCISIGPGTKNLWINDVACGPGHGISIGSLGKSLNEEGVQNVTVSRVVFKGGQNGLRIKTWARASNGFVKGVLFQHAVMKDVKNPIIIDQHYCINKADSCPKENSGIQISQVRYKDIKGTSASEVVVNFNCSASYPCKGIVLQDINLTYYNQSAEASCQNIYGTSYGSVVPASCLY